MSNALLGDAGDARDVHVACNADDISERERARAAVIAAASASASSLQRLVTALGPQLTSLDALCRARGTELLARALEALSLDALDGRAAHHLVVFYADRLDDLPCIPAAALGLRALLSRELADEDVRLMCAALFEKLHVPALAQPERLASYDAMACLLETKTEQLVALELGATVAMGVVKSVEGEKDPRNLLRSFALVRTACETVVARVAARGAVPLDACVDELFDVVSCYFPIRFTPPPGDPHGITAEHLRAAWHDTVSCDALGARALALMLKTLADPAVPPKLDALLALEATAERLGARTLGGAAPTLVSELAALMHQSPADSDEARACMQACKHICAALSAPDGAEDALHAFVTPLLERELPRTLSHAAASARDAPQVAAEAATSSALPPSVRLLCASAAARPAVAALVARRALPAVCGALVEAMEHRVSAPVPAPSDEDRAEPLAAMDVDGSTPPHGAGGVLSGALHALLTAAAVGLSADDADAAAVAADSSLADSAEVTLSLVQALRALDEHGSVAVAARTRAAALACFGADLSPQHEADSLLDGLARALCSHRPGDGTRDGALLAAAAAGAGNVVGDLLSRLDAASAHPTRRGKLHALRQVVIERVVSPFVAGVQACLREVASAASVDSSMLARVSTELSVTSALASTAVEPPPDGGSATHAGVHWLVGEALLDGLGALTASCAARGQAGETDGRKQVTVLVLEAIHRHLSADEQPPPGAVDDFAARALALLGDAIEPMVSMPSSRAGFPALLPLIGAALRQILPRLAARDQQRVLEDVAHALSEAAPRAPNASDQSHAASALRLAHCLAQAPDREAGLRALLPVISAALALVPAAASSEPAEPDFCRTLVALAQGSGDDPGDRRHACGALCSLANKWQPAELVDVLYPTLQPQSGAGKDSGPAAEADFDAWLAVSRGLFVRGQAAATEAPAVLLGVCDSGAAEWATTLARIGLGTLACAQHTPICDEECGTVSTSLLGPLVLEGGARTSRFAGQRLLSVAMPIAEAAISRPQSPSSARAWLLTLGHIVNGVPAASLRAEAPRVAALFTRAIAAVIAVSLPAADMAATEAEQVLGALRALQATYAAQHESPSAAAPLATKLAEHLNALVDFLLPLTHAHNAMRIRSVAGRPVARHALQRVRARM